jgi:hypothetical protein
MNAQVQNQEKPYEYLVDESVKTILDLESPEKKGTHTGNWYLIVDGSQMEQAKHFKEDANVVYLLKDLREYRELEYEGPWLIRFHTKEGLSGWINSWLMAKHPSALTWIYSAMSLDELKDHLIDQIKVCLADERMKTLRFYDARVLAAMRTVFTQEQMCRLLSGTQAWFIAPKGKLIVLEGNLKRVKDNRPYVLTQAQQDQMTDLLLPYGVIGELSDIPGYDRTLTQYSQTQQINISETWVSLAKELGLTSLSGITSFVGMGFTYGPNVYQQPQITEQLSELKRKLKEQPEIAEDLLRELKKSLKRV